MAGLRNICKAYGGIRVKHADGTEDEWVWDYARDEPRLKSDMQAEWRAEQERRRAEKVEARARRKKQGDLFRP